MAKKHSAEDLYDAAFYKSDGTEYGGKIRFRVEHPCYKPVRVAAPDEDSAIVAAATVWGVPWTRYEVYAFASAVRC